MPVLVLALRVSPAWGSVSTDRPTLEVGYRQMYDLDFEGAHQTFATWENSQPRGPTFGPVSNAAAYLFAEMNRLHILESELFSDNQMSERRQRFEPDPKTRAAFDDEPQRGESMANQILSHSPETMPRCLHRCW